jgi:hypothetical protein
MTNISTLQQSLINAKKVMNKVDGSGFSTETLPTTRTSQVKIDESELLPSLPPSRTIPTGERKPNLNPKASLTEDRINDSNLPDIIKQAMISNPIPDIPFNGGGAGLSDDFLNGVKEQMVKQGLGSEEQIVTKPQPKKPIKEQKSHKKLTSSNLKTLIKESVKELLVEVVNERINESIGLSEKSNENFQFRVGDKVFYGKITSSKTVK